MKTLSLITLLAFAVLRCSASTESPVGRAVHLDFESRVFLPRGHYIKDHSLVLANGVFHLFYITGTDSLGRWRQPGNEVDFGHATSSDLRNWRVLPRVVDWQRTSWESRNRWAPHVVKAGSEYRMYYTGVNGDVAQSIGMATSDDLHSWQASAATPFHPDSSWARWSQTSWSDCRDPFVFRYEGDWWMAYTAQTKERQAAIGMATSKDGLTWADEGPLVVGEQGEPLESVQLFESAGRWFLLFTSGRHGGTWVLEGDSPLGPFDVDTRQRWLDSIAPEITTVGETHYVSRHGSFTAAGGGQQFVLLIDRFAVTASGLTLEPETTPGEGWAHVEGAAFARQPILGDNPMLRGEASIELVGNGWLGSREGFYRPPDEPGGLLGERATGLLRSVSFPIDTHFISFRLGGTRNPEAIAIRLRRADDDAILLESTGTGVERLTEQRWRTQDLQGTLAYIEIVDADSMGHINVDDIIGYTP